MASKKKSLPDPAKALSYPTHYYLPFELLEGGTLSAEEQRAELKHLLKVARDRQRRLKKSEFSSSFAARYVYPKMSRLKDPRQVSQALAEVAEMIRSRRSTVSGARAYQAEIVSTLSETFDDAEISFEDFSQRQWKEFGRYMHDLKKAGKANEGADSERAVKMFFMAKGVGLTAKGLKENYDQFLQRQGELQQLYENNPYGRRNASGQTIMARLDSLSNSRKW